MAEVAFSGGEFIKSDEGALVARAARRMMGEMREADSQGFDYYSREVVDDFLLALGTMFEPHASGNVKHPDQALPALGEFLKEYGLPNETTASLKELEAELEQQEGDTASAIENTSAAEERLRAQKELLGKAAAALSRVPGQEGLIKELQEAGVPEPSPTVVEAEDSKSA